MTQANSDMSTAPKDRNILIRTIVYHYDTDLGWQPAGHCWVEAWWCEKSLGREPQFVEWCGNKRTMSSNQLHPVAWAELPS